MNRFVEAKLVDYTTIHVSILNSNKDANYIFTLVIDNDVRRRIEGSIISKTDNCLVYEFKLKEEIVLGHDYHVVITNLGIYSLNVNALAALPNFDERYAYDGNDLGFTYSRRKTSFALWAPLASSVILVIDNQDYYPMSRTDKGVYRVTIEKNLKGHIYNYLVTNSGVTSKTIDPYAKASTANSKNSVVLDMNSFKMNMHDHHPEKMNSYLDAIIYEGHVRDLTIDPNTDIKHKGKFLGLVEENRKNKDGLSVGFDYIKNLGITHLQLLPIYDYATVDELNPDKTYNWGYDPIQYFVPEGSFASDVNDPSSRIKDLLEMISKFHQAGIRVVMDVVFNHVYEHQHSSLEAVVPNYFFRRTSDGNYFNSSGCGNDLASERKMVRKLIIDACKWWADFYHVDGFRFDLMGIIDTETINQLRETIISFRSDFMFYGEGWNMMSGYNLVLANADNHKKIQYVSFFNDYFRDITIGNVGSKAWGYALNSGDFHNQFKEVFTGCTFNLIGKSKFNHVACSINFVECHDNNTLYDKINIIRPDLTEEEKLKRVNLANTFTMLALGIPFFHAGQEIGLSKGGNPNTYNAGDALNYFNYSLLKERNSMVEHFKKLCALRKRIRILHEANMSIVDKNITISDLENNGMLVTYNTRIAKDKPYRRVTLYINPTNASICYTRKDKRVVVIPPLDVLEEEEEL